MSAKAPGYRAEDPGEPSASNAREEPKAQTIRLPPELWRQLKYRAIDEERPMSELIRNAIQAYLATDPAR